MAGARNARRLGRGRKRQTPNRRRSARGGTKELPEPIVPMGTERSTNERGASSFVRRAPFEVEFRCDAFAGARCRGRRGDRETRWLACGNGHRRTRKWTRK